MKRMTGNKQVIKMYIYRSIDIYSICYVTPEKKNGIALHMKDPSQCEISVFLFLIFPHILEFSTVTKT